jgi:peptidoglycan/LPS O-acetylase OafA/YrhL
VRERIARIAGSVAAVAAGGVVAFVTTGPALFADGPFQGRIVALGLGCLLFAVLGGVLGLASPTRWKSLAVSAWAPGVAVALFFIPDLTSRPALLALAVAFVIGDLAAVLAGAWLTTRWRGRRVAASTDR